jgi:thiol-disulfide isomerase/thioredoxin
MTRRQLVIGAVVLAALVGAVAAVSAGRHRAGSAFAARGQVSGNGAVGSTIGRFRGRDIDGRVLTIASGKPGVLLFIAGWCGDCLPDAVLLGRVAEQYGSRINAVAVSPDPSDSVGALRRFRHNAGSPRYPFVWDRDGSLARPLRVSALDTTLVYDARGRVVYRGVAPDGPTLRGALRRAGVT